jgi:hypothetical protein
MLVTVSLVTWTLRIRYGSLILLDISEAAICVLIAVFFRLIYERLEHKGIYRWNVSDQELRAVELKRCELLLYFNKTR